MKRFFSLIGFFVFFLLAGAVYISYSIFTPTPIGPEPVKIAGSAGDTVSDIAAVLHEKGILPMPFLLHLVASLQKDRLLQQGDYLFVKEVNVIGIHRILTSGPTRFEKNIKIIEGWTVDQIASYLEKEGFGSADAFLAKLYPASYRSSYSFLARMPDTSTLEGYLFPDTYRVFHDATQEDIIEKLLTNFDRKFTPAMRSEAFRQGHTIHEVVTLASIIEREVTTDDERTMVADIFLRRIKQGIPLQADSTVNYITKKNTPQATIADTHVDSPYNTYRYRGLPPGAIGNPSLSSLQAVLYPTKNDYWFFLTSPDGAVHYSKTFDEHKAKKAKYL